MQRLYGTTVHEVGSDAAELLASGVMILFATGAPPELAEVSVLHSGAGEPGAAPMAGDALAIGGHRFRVTAVGDTAWAKVRDIGHVVFSFNGADIAERPGEICIAPQPDVDLAALLTPGTAIELWRN